jgi:hypothetical protein
MAAAGHRLAMYNFGLHVAADTAPEVQGFMRREPLNFAAAERRQGFPDDPDTGACPVRAVGATGLPAVYHGQRL